MPSYQLTNEKMLEVQLNNETVYAKRGAMLAYQGQVAFSRSFLGSEGIQGAAMRVVTNEGYQLMAAVGTGSVYYGQNGLFVTVITLRGETFYAESDSLLAYDGRLRTGTVFQGNQGVQGLIRGAATGQGLFTTTLEGTGELAIVSDGNIIALEVTAQKPICVDPNAYIGHKGQVTSAVITDVNWKTLIGQASGESYQLKFTGLGTVYIQASER
ncbi:MAG: AIM24 family protein [Candidatus Sericytochromatia bacterium]|nr:AIM24 family protein [Candidatus Sericytochromatia bacterium]